MAKINGNEIRPGQVLDHQNQLWSVVKTNSVKPGKGGAFNQVEMRNLRNGSKLNERFRASQTVERVRLEQRSCQYLYNDGDSYAFMDQENFEQFNLQKNFVGNKAQWLQDSMIVRIEFYETEPLALQLPDVVVLEVSETEPVVKGQTAASSFKPALCKNGARVMVPPFVNEGEQIQVQTSDGSYLKRADA